MHLFSVLGFFIMLLKASKCLKFGFFRRIFMNFYLSYEII